MSSSFMRPLVDHKKAMAAARCKIQNLQTKNRSLFHSLLLLLATNSAWGDGSSSHKKKKNISFTNQPEDEDEDEDDDEEGL